MREIPAATARRIAVAAQGFGRLKPASSGRRAVSSVLATTRLLQIDSVAAAVRAHYAPVFSRVGPYDRSALDRAAWSDTARSPRLMVEYWAHEAAFVPVEDWPLLRWRMDRYVHGRWGGAQRVAERHPRLVDDVLDAIRDGGPATARDLEVALDRRRPGPKGPWWDHSDVKVVCEQLFASGVLTVPRRTNFVRVYDLTERVLPPDVAAQRVGEEDAVRRLVDHSAAAMGIATAADLRDYYRLSAAQTTAALADLVDAGRVVPTTVAGWKDSAYRHVDARRPRAVDTAALLCPFDPLIFGRARTERVFDFHYRIEIYTPEAQRRYGYYVFPFLLNDELVARVDLRVDRAAGLLTVPGTFSEDSVDARGRRAEVAAALAGSVRAMAEWLDVDVAVGDRGDLARDLRVAVS
ncbi:winged helix-turn-helix domain-containing protein [Rhodococcoides corynebacterioides]|uniref:winged helix-turn-helix domain-containing protein n=1 Tax=Rhodococcoides corynebacterioides TaxID=53972 RepID=UPI001C9B5168|nr:crosslink repair DNA glycosylase YcaQ family protein [Rhodococcus corynebacterioides]MBY6362149.1 winged helix-turn-helix domain-containing protein [Rhodococcus corynebacterioides]